MSVRNALMKRQIFPPVHFLLRCRPRGTRAYPEKDRLLQSVKVHMSSKVPYVGGRFFSSVITDERSVSELRITEKLKAVLFKVCNI